MAERRCVTFDCSKNQVYVYDQENLDYIVSWEQVGRDRVRFQNRITSLENILAVVLKHKLSKINGSDILCT
jgi:hypothetical protein